MQLFSGSAELLDEFTRRGLAMAGGFLTRLPDSALGIGTTVLAAFLTSAELPRIRQWLRELRQREKVATDEHERFWLSRRKLGLGQMLQQMNELADLTEHYYERSYWRDEKYRL